MPYEEFPRVEGPIMIKMKFMTSKRGSLLAADSAIISINDLLLENKSLVKRELCQVPG